jgi:oligoendopeptidase F
MRRTVPLRSEISEVFTWDTANVFADDASWEAAITLAHDEISRLRQGKGELGHSPSTLRNWLQQFFQLANLLERIYLYASMYHNVDTTDQEAAAKHERAISLWTSGQSALAFAEPEILAVGYERLQDWMEQEPELKPYAHYFDSLEGRRSHIRSAEVEEVLGLVQDPFISASQVHGTFTDADLQFSPAHTSSGETLEITQGTIGALLTSPDPLVRATAWQNYADAHLACKHGLAGCLVSGVKQDVFFARVRGYKSSLEASLAPNHIPVAVFHNLIATFKRHLPTWHRYWALRRQALGVERLHVFDAKAPLTSRVPLVPFEQAVEWICAGMAPLGDEYVGIMRRGLLEQRWVDLYPNRGKRAGAYSHGAPNTHPFILMSYNDDIFSMSTLAHELGHSLHSFYAWESQPLHYTNYSLFVAEVASNFNQALVRAWLLGQDQEPPFQISVIEEAMANFHRYFFVMPTLARFELEIHERVERGESLTANSLILLMSDLFREGYGDDVVIDVDRVGITWAQFATHLYSNFYVYQYATGISAAHALARGVLVGSAGTVDNYLKFLKAGGSLYPLEALRLAGIDMMSPEPIEQAFETLAIMVARLEQLIASRQEWEA